ncbi:Gibberellin 20-oxidase [Penicillium riverlandense]|uniref:Gibberellin 20-oxidase n=1 Tax=Penicillium riverlandense TaxID=1903569 RepID=UPI00254986DF|nr:Gibberellin 20-oxidase [Penicillium riverlandense]KAJ5819949.1 Gibberellin 20-oxidase [Penicillium riverlandense]
MTTTFSSLPVVDVGPLGSPAGATDAELSALSQRLYDVFATTGFAYLTNVPLSFKHAEVFQMSRDFFALPTEEKMKLAKRSFRRDHQNTYRGYFPTQPELASDNLKEGFEMGPAKLIQAKSVDPSSKFNLAEPNVWPDEKAFTSREKLEKLYVEMQSLASKLLSLLAMSLGKPADFFAPYLVDSLSTLRLLHYPAVTSVASGSGPTTQNQVKLSCTQHTDSGILTLLHQDSTGGLEVRNSSGDWVAAPYIPESLVVNIGDLMAKVSGGRFVATMHRVRAPEPSSSAAVVSNQQNGETQALGRISVPFFFEPGENCLVRSVDAEEGFVVYGEHVRTKMKTWVEFQDDDGN